MRGTGDRSQGIGGRAITVAGLDVSARTTEGNLPVWRSLFLQCLIQTKGKFLEASFVSFHFEELESY
jgi:hypothetical protein